MKNCITFESVGIAIVVYLSVQSVSIDTLLTNYKILKQQPECLQVVNQIIRSDA